MLARTMSRQDKQQLIHYRGLHTWTDMINVQQHEHRRKMLSISQKGINTHQSLPHTTLQLIIPGQKRQGNQFYAYTDPIAYIM
jgi:hypothetical protein